MLSIICYATCADEIDSYTAHLLIVATWQGCGHIHVLYVVHYHGNQPL